MRTSFPRLTLFVAAVLFASVFAFPQSNSQSSAGEASAVGSMRVYNTACVLYASLYGVGFPSSLDVLRGDGTARNSDHSGILNNELTAPPYQKSGYRFIYRRESPGRYTVIGRPLEFAKTGHLSFFTDQTGVIRFTDEDRAPTSEDRPIH
jgi:hypothetical protein